MKIILGFFSLAKWKRFFMSFSDSPTHFEIKSEDEIEKKVPSDSVAHALAK
jgi:hypothetical protein